MKPRLITLSQRYVAALRRHLKRGPRASLQPAARLGQQAAALGLETPGLARIHRRALAILTLSHGERGRIQQARIFFIEAVIPVVQTQRAALESGHAPARGSLRPVHSSVRV